MKVKDIILRALAFAGRDDVVTALEANAKLNDEQNEAVRTAVLCFNAVEDELARHYLPLKTTEKFCSGNGEIEFSSFSKCPIKILSVKNSLGECNFKVLSQKIVTRAGEVNIEYDFAPVPKGIGDDSVYTESQASLFLIAAGTASEFCLISGDAGAASVWEEKYRREIDLVQHEKYHAKIPPRRWV